jgi:hypothetical protein
LRLALFNCRAGNAGVDRISRELAYVLRAHKIVGIIAENVNRGVKDAGRRKEEADFPRFSPA